MRSIPIAVALVTAALALPAVAMEFRSSLLPTGSQVVFATGDIVVGDAERLRQALAASAPDETGFMLLALHSDGGLVGEALQMVEVMDRIGVTTVVPPGARCASACASVVWVGGTNRVIIEGGLIGMHHCYAADGQLLPECNDEIATAALHHGVAYGSVRAFMDAAGPSEMIWFDAEMADCYGLTRLPGEDVASSQDAPCVVKAIQEMLSGN